MSDEKLNVLYKAGRKWYLQHATKPEVREASVPAALTLAYALTTADARASQTKSYMNAHQKQSFDEQLAQGQQPTSAPMRTHPYLSTATHGSPPTCRSQVAGCGEHALVGGAYCTLKRRILPMWAVTSGTHVHVHVHVAQRHSSDMGRVLIEPRAHRMRAMPLCQTVTRSCSEGGRAPHLPQRTLSRPASSPANASHHL